MKTSGHNFKTNVLLKNVLGKDLINDDNIAVQELVKNSYDAGATKIHVIFENLKANDDDKAVTYQKKTDRTTRVTIQDDGKGMDVEDIDWKWLNIAYSEKKTQKEDMGRTLAGNKGVGRFSCDRLGEYLDLYTRKNGKSYIHLFLDWKNFEEENRKELQIQAVEVSVREIAPKAFERETGQKPFSHGTTLIISKLRSNWTTAPIRKEYWETRKLLDLRKSLEKLINPDVTFKKGHLRMELLAPEFKNEDADPNRGEHEKINGEIKNRIFEKLDFKTTSIESEITVDGKSIRTTLKDKGRRIFELVEKNTEFKLLKDIKITVYYLGTYSKVYFHKQTGMRSVSYGSIHLFVNGFRVPPYGDLGDDWLGIDRMKQQGFADYLGSREIVGRIEIVDREGMFKIVSSREGLVDDSRFRQLVGDQVSAGYFDLTFRRLNRYVVEGLHWDRTMETDKDIEKRIFAPGKRINYAEEVYLEKQDDKDRRAMGVIISIINPKSNDFESLWINPELIQNLQAEEQDRLRKIIGDVERFGPGLMEKGTKNAFRTLKQVVERQEKRIAAAEEKNLELTHKYREKESQAKALAATVRQKEREVFFHKRLLSSDLKHVVSLQHAIGIAANTIKQNLILLKDAVLSGAKLSNERLLKFVEDISFQNSKIVSISNFVTKANFNTDATEIQSDLIEFLKQYLENVCKGVMTTHDGHPMGIHFGQVRKSDSFELRFKPIEIAIVLDNLMSNSRKARAGNVYIAVEKKSDEELEIRFKDDGRGVSKDIQDKIFDFGFTTTSGSGIGLNHIISILKGLKGEITLNPENERGAEFMIKVRK